jgi:hypothetical protein
MWESVDRSSVAKVLLYRLIKPYSTGKGNLNPHTMGLLAGFQLHV